MYDMMPPQPTQFVPPPEKKHMSVIQIMLIVAALGFLVWYLITSLAPEPDQYAYVTAGTIGTRYNGDCLIIRDESPFDAESVSSIDYVAEEGTMVSAHATVCNVYTSGFSTRELTTLQDGRDQIKEYQMKRLGQEIVTDAQMEKLESDVLTRAREVRDIIGGARGNMSNQEKYLEDAIRNRQRYLKEKYADDPRLNRLLEDEQSQLQKINSWTKQYTTVKPGVVSFYSDGYEYGLSVNNYYQFTPGEVRSMINGAKPARDTIQKGRTTIYRLVQDGYWYVVMLIRDNTLNPVEGTEYELRLENFKDTTVKARVVSFSRMGGELAVRLSVSSSVLPVLYIRSCAGVLGEDVTSLMVPVRAIYEQDNMVGIVQVDESDYKHFIPVNILEKRDGMCYIAPIQQGTLKENDLVMLFN